jgi:hypothetical protein
MLVGAMKNSVQDKPVQAHMFEYTTSFALDPSLRFKYPDRGIVPTQIIFCLKEKNAKQVERCAALDSSCLLTPTIVVVSFAERSTVTDGSVLRRGWNQDG